MKQHTSAELYLSLCCILSLHIFSSACFLLSTFSDCPISNQTHEFHLRRFVPMLYFRPSWYRGTKPLACTDGYLQKPWGEDFLCDQVYWAFYSLCGQVQESCDAFFLYTVVATFFNPDLNLLRASASLVSLHCSLQAVVMVFQNLLKLSLSGCSGPFALSAIVYPNSLRCSWLYSPRILSKLLVLVPHWPFTRYVEL